MAEAVKMLMKMANIKARCYIIFFFLHMQFAFGPNDLSLRVAIFGKIMALAAYRFKASNSSSSLLRSA